MPRFLPSGSARPATLLAALIALNLLLLLFFLAFDYQLIFHSDAAVKNLLAQEIVETGHYFPPEWNYVNKDLWVFYTHTFIVPLLAWMPNGYWAHMVSDCVSAALILGGGWLFLRLLGATPLARLAGLALLSAGLSTTMAEHVYGQAAYGSMFYLACFLLYGYWSQLQSRGRAWWGWGLLTAAVAVQACWSNPQRALIFYVLPVLAASATLLVLERRAPRGTLPPAPHGRTAALFLAACCAGIVLNAVTVRQVHNLPGLTAIAWLDFAGICSNVLAVLYGILAAFDGLPHLSSKVVSATGAYQVLRLLAALAALYLLPRALYRALGGAHRGRLFCAVFTAVALALNLILMLTTTLADMRAPDGSIRYLVPSLLCMLLLFAVTAVDRLDAGPVRLPAALIVLAVLATSAPAAYLLPYLEQFRLPPARILPGAETRLLAFLDQQHLRYGYATFWHAGKLTVLSAHHTRIRAIEMQDGVPMPFRPLSSNRWYDPAYFQGETFLLVRDGEPRPDLARLAPEAGAPSRTLRFENWQVIVFRTNLAVLSSWDNAVRQPRRYAITAQTPHGTGSFLPDQAALAARPGDTGVLHFGPFRSLDAGTYEVRFDLETGPGRATPGVVDVVSGADVFASVAIAGTGRRPLPLRFTLKHPAARVEFRVITNGTGAVVLRGVDLARVDAAHH